jgi:hypothetical protein
VTVTHASRFQILKEATEFFSRDDTPNLATVIPAMDLIDNELTNFTLDKKLNPAIRAAVNLAKKTLNRYYDKTDHTEVYRIAMSMLFCISSHGDNLTYHFSVLHPRHKLSYFKTAGWDQEWIEAAENICRDEFERKYKGKFTPEVSETGDKPERVQKSQVRSFFPHHSLFF